MTNEEGEKKIQTYRVLRRYKEIDGTGRKLDCGNGVSNRSFELQFEAIFIHI